VDSLLNPGEEILDNPYESQLYNATKISGRTRKGLGLGFFNAIAGKEYAKIKMADDKERRIETNPLTNYNVLVADQNLNNNSYLTIINTNVWRAGDARDANVTGSQFSIKSKDNKFELSGSAALSQLFEEGDTELGHQLHLEIGKRSGNLVYETGYKLVSHTYDPNDMGFINNNNEQRIHQYIEYNQYQPFGKFLQMGGGFFHKLSFLHKFPQDAEVVQNRKNLFTDYGINAWWWLRTKKNVRFHFWIYTEPFESFDYHEPRIAGRYYEQPGFFRVGGRLTTDLRKRFFIASKWSYFRSKRKGMDEYTLELEPAYRFNDKLSISLETEIENGRNEEGYVTDINDDVIFGLRDLLDINNLLKVNYVLNANMNIKFRLRHNWTRVEYNSFHLLSLDGKLTNSEYHENENINFNAFNIDAMYRWRFAPGSDIFVVWKNSIIGEDEVPRQNYSKNLNDLFDNPISNSISLKVVYYLDYLKTREIFRKK
jgi:hypothetical protein